MFEIEARPHIVQVKNPRTGQWSKMEFGPFNSKRDAEREKRWLEITLGGEFRVVEDEPLVHQEQWV